MSNDSRNFKKFKKGPLLLSMLLVGLSFSAFFLLSQKVNDNKQLSGQMQIEWQTEAERRIEIKTLNSSIKEIENERALLDSHFAKGSDIVPFLDALEGLASAVSLKMEIVSVDILKDKNNLLVNLNTTGSFEKIYKFILLLENSPYELEFALVDLKNLTIIPEDSEPVENSLQWNANFKIKLLSFVP